MSFFLANKADKTNFPISFPPCIQLPKETHAIWLAARRSRLFMSSGYAVKISSANVSDLINDFILSNKSHMLSQHEEKMLFTKE